MSEQMDYFRAMQADRQGERAAQKEENTKAIFASGLSFRLTNSGECLVFREGNLLGGIQSREQQMSAVGPPLEEVKPPRRFCVRCKTEVDPKRVMRGSPFCSNECRKEDLKERRDYRASKACRLCGRPAKHRKPQIVSSDVCDGGTAQKTASQQQSREA